MISDGEFIISALHSFYFTKGLQAPIVTIEQLSLFKVFSKGTYHHSLACSHLRCKIQVPVDEAHSIYTAGIRKHGQPPFRPAYGLLDVRLLFSKHWTVSAGPPNMRLRLYTEFYVFEKFCLDYGITQSAKFVRTTAQIG
jgi:hypothetical protein